MASSGSDGGGEGEGRRYNRNLQGILQFATENTVTEDASGPSNLSLTQMDPERKPNPTITYGKSLKASSSDNNPELARVNQDRALEVLGLHRFRVAGDGNCLFRAVAWQLKFDQEKYHPILRKEAVQWMRGNKEELLDWGLLDSEKEIKETEELGVWPGQAAIVALSNIFGVNIAVVQGGDKGDIDIQHICPFETPSANGEQGNVILAYLYNGHYDAVVEQPNMANPEFEAWTIRRNREREADEALAWKLAAEEGYNGSTTQPIVDMRKECEGDEALARRLMEEEFHTGMASSRPVSDLIQHVSEVQVSSQTKPLETKLNQLENPLIIHTPSTGASTLTYRPKTLPPSKPPPRHALQSCTVIHTNIPDRCGLPDRPTRPPPRKTNGDDIPDQTDESRMRLTLYPKKQNSLEEEVPELKRHVYKPAVSPSGLPESQLRVNRRPADNDTVMQRRLRESNPNPSNEVIYPRTRSPSIRIIPIQFVGRTPQSTRMSQSGTGNGAPTRASSDLERRAGVKRRETPTEEYSRDSLERSMRARQNTPPQQHASYTLVNDPTRTTSQAHHHVHHHPHPRTSADLSLSNLSTPHHSTSTASRRSPTTGTARQVPVVVLSARSQQPSSATLRARATPAPATYDLSKNFDIPPALKPYRPALDNSEFEMMLRRHYWQ